MLGVARLRASLADVSLMPASTAVLKSPSRELPDTQVKLRRAAGGRSVRNRQAQLASGSQTAVATESPAAILEALQKRTFFQLFLHNGWELGDDPHTDLMLCASCVQQLRWNGAQQQSRSCFSAREVSWPPVPVHL